MEGNDDFQKKAFEVWFAVTEFMATYQKEGNAVVRNVVAMLPYATDLQNFWSAYRSAESNQLIRKLHTKVRARIQLMRECLDRSIEACGSDDRLLDKYSENQNYILRKLSELQALVPREPRTVKEPEQVLLEFGSEKPADSEEKPVEQPVDEWQSKSERFLKRLNELRTSVNGFVSSYDGVDVNGSVVGYVSDMEGTIRVLDGLWRRYVVDRLDATVAGGLEDSMSKCVASLRSQYSMSVMVRDSGKDADRYRQNHEYVLKKLEALERAFKL